MGITGGATWPTGVIIILTKFTLPPKQGYTGVVGKP